MRSTTGEGARPKFADTGGDARLLPPAAGLRRGTVERSLPNMGDLKSKRLIVLKGWLFLLLATLALAGLCLQSPSWRTLALGLILAWASARFYYFLFYVLEKYVDPALRYAGVLDQLQALLRRRRR